MLEALEIGGCDSDLQRPGLESIGDLPDATREASQRPELGVERAQELIGLEAPRRLGEDDVAAFVLEQGDRIELGVEGPRDRIGLRERLTD